MKKILFIAITIILCTHVYAQEKQNNIPFISEGMPTFPGGDQAMMKFIGDSLRWPHHEMCVQGRVVTRFLVRKDGTLDSIHVIRGIHPVFDEEAMRVVRAMPKWIPLENHPADTWFTLPIFFRLNDKLTLQTDTIIKDTVLHTAEVMPKYPEGEMAMMNFIAMNLKYPITNGSDGGTQGRVVVRFVVAKTGEIKQIKILRGISQSCDREAIRVVESMPKWISGKQDGKEVDVYFTLPILFRMR